MEIQSENYHISYNPATMIVNFRGSFRLNGMKDYEPIVNFLNEVAQQEPPTIILDLQKLEFLNSSGISMLSKFIINMRKKQTSNIVVKGSKNIPWQDKSLKNLQRLMPNLVLEFN
ncbi:conserved hypothetical protein [Gloeothece citriformis PCC 7424]|uniref:STAS domain-containing protein n=1 Tax=Gloeothece citriformis (strain PCC 7424) TaxID=65393 RepID=B7K9J1_GLOC7|nr:STAS domain-containing protein [Gloeothece citriformis]ACK69959.1 conserved hypothetical protein [Gloeothece citriformis PCC 7424]